MSFKKAVQRNKVSGLMFGSTFNTGRSAPVGNDLVIAQQRQARNAILMSIKSTWVQRHRIGICLARVIVNEQVGDYRQSLEVASN
ncbi:hypothetical protein [Stutzerimonas frequens]|jgi:hypothetical protein|uniref:hypothetical protein n=1 Tax=Stutzerimonas frequens TaxID=2968969 RepID=UPI001AAE8CA9|nr:hypothetical protein [Stutzerimonas frequens]QTF59125.1 hypothetical protein J4H94_20760 [Stutzerimonas frequens]